MFAMVQDAVERRLGRKWVRRCVGARVRWWDRAYDVPLLQSLQQMLRIESILSEVWYIVGAWMYYSDTSNNRLSENLTTSV